jgi:DNA adenine methylase
VRFVSPLRYPGGKARLAPFLTTILEAQPHRAHTYCEPFAGGAGAALRLLIEERVRRVSINDLDPGIAAFWRCVFQNNRALVRRVQNARVDLEAWKECRAIYASPAGVSDLELGYATFFLNRCNRSGIISARPIGGLEQTGMWKLDARFNREDLASRISLLGEYSARVDVFQLDARTYITDILASASNVLIYVDPPYLREGEDLYLDALKPEDHKELAGVLARTSHPWVATYDVEPMVHQVLFPRHRIMEYSISHTAHRQHIGEEYIVFSHNIRLPAIPHIGSRTVRWVSLGSNDLGTGRQGSAYTN